MDDAFEGDFSDEDWDHGLGGIHALVRDEQGLAAHGSVIMRRVLHGDRRTASATSRRSPYGPTAPGGARQPG